jgi:Zn-finger nucleic acid-binding protein
MFIIEFQGVEIDYCPACNGIWLDRNELDIVLNSPPARAWVNGSRGTRRCPYCHRRMITGPLRETCVTVDECRDHGLWLDEDELQQIIGHTTGEESPLSTYCRDLFPKLKNTGEKAP